MIVVGVDPGLTTGFAVVEVSCGGWSLRMREDYRSDKIFESRGEQLHAIFRRLHWFRDYFDPTGEDGFTLAMEEMLAYSSRSADEKVEAQAIVKLFSAMEPVTLVTYAPATVRSVVVSNSRATAGEVKGTMRYLCRMGKTNKKGEAFTVHQQDALAVALCHALRGGALQILDRCKEQ